MAPKGMTVGYNRIRVIRDGTKETYGQKKLLKKRTIGVLPRGFGRRVAPRKMGFIGQQIRKSGARDLTLMKAAKGQRGGLQPEQHSRKDTGEARGVRGCDGKCWQKK